MAYIPNRGDLVWMEFSPQMGHEQKGRRPAVIISSKAYNKKIGLAICCPITSKRKGYPFEIVLKGQKIKGAVLSDQVKSVDWRLRRAQFIEKAKEETVLECVRGVIELMTN